MLNGMQYRRTDQALATPVDNELVMFDAEAGRYFGLNEVATAIWERLEHPHSLDELVESLTAEFDISKEKCREELEAFLPRLSERGLIEPV